MLARDRDIQRQMMTSKLDHPRIFLGGLPEDGNVKEILAEHRILFVPLENLVAFHDLLNFFKSPSAERGGNQSERGGTLRSIQFLHAKPSPRDHSGRQVDHRARCFTSSNANNTLARCFSSSVARNAFPAPTIREVAVCATAVLTDKQAKTDNIDQRFMSCPPSAALRRSPP
jgi:hypothetical protein